jgi:hypothetical protein
MKKNFTKNDCIIFASDNNDTMYYCTSNDDIEQTIEGVFNEKIDCIDFDDCIIYTKNHELEFMLLNDIGKQILFDVSNKDISNINNSILLGIFYSDYKDIYSK